MDRMLVNLLSDVGLGLVLLILGFSVGTIGEKRHYRSIRKREREFADILLIPVRTPPASLMDSRGVFVCGSVVVGMDYFKRALAYLRNLVGGQVGSYESLVERARREAVLRMKDEARRVNAKYIMNIKFTTANVMGGGGGTGDKKGSGCIEVLAYGTALVPR